MKEVSKIIKEVLGNYTLQGDSTDLSAEVTVIEPEEAGFCYGTLMSVASNNVKIDGNLYDDDRIIRKAYLTYDNYDNNNTSLESLDEMFDDIYPFVNLFKTKCEKFLRDKVEKEGGSIIILDDQLITSIANRSEVINKISSVGDNIEFSTKNGCIFFASSLSPEELYNVVEQFNNLKID